jgi:hypothetical protein
MSGLAPCNSDATRLRKSQDLLHITAVASTLLEEFPSGFLTFHRDREATAEAVYAIPRAVCFAKPVHLDQGGCLRGKMQHTIDPD